MVIRLQSWALSVALFTTYAALAIMVGYAGNVSAHDDATPPLAEPDHSMHSTLPAIPATPPSHHQHATIAAISIQLAPYRIDALFTDTIAACPNRALACYENRFHDLTLKHGPRAAIELFAKLLASRSVSDPTDGHHVAHHIGHHAAMALGLTAEVYSLCSADFNYGCQHGLLQYALGEGRGGVDAAASICRGVEADPSASTKDKAYCYHGLGHGVMGHTQFDLIQSLEICDRLSSSLAIQGCWQGAFMENVNQAQTGNAQKGLFANSDVLAPCNVVAEKYRHECFINHAGILIQRNQKNIGRATQACLAAPSAHIVACLESIGLMATNPEWQSSLLKPEEQRSFIENAWAFCRKFPAGRETTCVFAAVDNLINFDGLDATRANQFCKTGYVALRSECYRRIGENFRNLLVQTTGGSKSCDILDGPDRDACVSGLAPPRTL